ncbi:MAG: tRNA (adenosine(37)-N6)-dimethylallyltransferase MiaA [Bacteroidetes bacterium QS_8_64_10]|nr:MAG: tRNA (adenosine(37)-N6)-dimethylallyltransferase MiaA [Bacteroidetes bacterium QS_8_64_10]
MPSSSSPILTITGPTGVGKTALSLEAAERLDAEIISADSRQVYREINIGTATPSEEERRGVPHHFVNERSLDDPLSAGAFADEANERIRRIRERGHEPLVVGGSTLYVLALQQGLADIPDVEDAVRRRLEERLEEEGREALFDELKRVDPEAAEGMDATKTQRLTRALEVYHGTGRPISYYWENQPEPPFQYRTFVLNRDRQTLYDRIERRVNRMLERGLLDEVRRVREAGYDPDDCRALRTIGYRAPLRHLRGAIDYDEMVRLVKRNSRRYAKKQLTWFRRFDEYTWLEPPFEAEQVLNPDGATPNE